MARRLSRAIGWYQQARQDRPSPCRFYPSCSSYALDAIDQHGTKRGLWLASCRLLRCRPFGKSGYDPVPFAHEHSVMCSVPSESL
ncbi:MAG: membrane protein insertion efficiency factor YidD [Actinobacteria bacterium]|nr:membrane protein insertion efficiency factor YidD [Actinomycetota bacterium]